MSDLPRLLTRADVRALLGSISSSTLARWIAAGTVPGPLAGTTRWDRKAVEAALDRASGLGAASATGGSAWAAALRDDRAA